MTQQTVDPHIRTGQLKVEDVQQFSQPIQSGGAKNVDLEPQRVLQLMPGAATLDARP